MQAGKWRLKAESSDMMHLDAMRFFASAAIVLHHSHEFLVPPAQRPELQHRTYGLALFVDLFFLISGYVIARVYAGRVGDVSHILRFFQRRIGRLVPLHWLTLVLSMGLWAGILALTRSAGHVPNFSVACTVQTALLIHGWASCSHEILFNGVTWSISVEMALYVMFPAIVLIANRWRMLLPALTIGFLLWAATVARSYGLAAQDWTNVPAVLRALPTFLVGASLHFWGGKLKILPAPAVLLLPGLVALLIAIFTGASWPVQLTLVYCVGTLTVAADLRGGPGKWVGKVAPLGQLTYSIYMWHSIFILVIVNIVGDKILHLNFWPMLALCGLCYGLIGFGSYLSLILIETPARRWVDGLSFRR